MTKLVIDGIEVDVPAEQVVPTAANAAAVAVDQLTEGQAHGLLHVAGRVHVA